MAPRWRWVVSPAAATTASFLHTGGAREASRHCLSTQTFIYSVPRRSFTLFLSFLVTSPRVLLLYILVYSCVACLVRPVTGQTIRPSILKYFSIGFHFIPYKSLGFLCCLLISSCILGRHVTTHTMTVLFLWIIFFSKSHCFC